MRVVKVGGDDGELRLWHYIYVYSIESRLIRMNIKETHTGCGPEASDGAVRAS